jgi:hypothetical protein
MEARGWKVRPGLDFAENLKGLAGKKAERRDGWGEGGRGEQPARCVVDGDGFESAQRKEWGNDGGAERELVRGRDRRGSGPAG